MLSTKFPEEVYKSPNCQLPRSSNPKHANTQILAAQLREFQNVLLSESLKPQVCTCPRPQIPGRAVRRLGGACDDWWGMIVQVVSGLIVDLCGMLFAHGFVKNYRTSRTAIQLKPSPFSRFNLVQHPPYPNLAPSSKFNLALPPI